MITSTWITASPETKPLYYILDIQYWIQFWEDQGVQAQMNSRSKVNVMIPVYAAWLGLVVRSINVGTQKIDDLPFETYKMTNSSFLL